MTDRRTFLAAAGALTLAGCAGIRPDANGWYTVLDGARLSSVADLSGWTQIGKGGWSIVDGTLQGKGDPKDPGYILSPASYENFEMRVEFWADADANSGVFLRCEDRANVTAGNAYEVNIWDKRPDPNYGTGAIVDVARVTLPAPVVANRWNTYEITADGAHLVVVLNGNTTADVRNGQHDKGPFALQSAGGTIRFRKVQIRPITG